MVERALSAAVTGKARALAAALSIAATAPGCSGSPSAGPRPGGTATIVLRADVATVIEWHATSDADRLAARLLFRALARKGSKPGELVPDLASSWNVLPDGRSLRVTLGPGATWEDGQPVTSDDVAFSIGRSRLPGSSIASSRRAIVEAEAAGPESVVVRFDGPADPWVATTLTGRVYPKHLLEAIPDAELPRHPWSARPVGSGPFRLESAEPGRRWVFARRDNDGNTGAPGSPRLDRIVATIEPDRGRAIRELEAGRVDLVTGLSRIELDAVAAGGKARILTAPAEAVVAVDWNTRRRPFDLPAVRRGLGELIDRVALYRSFEGDRPPAGLPAGDVARGKQTLLDAGLRRNASGAWIGPDGRPLIVTLVSEPSPEIRDLASRIGEDLHGGGFSIELRTFRAEELSAWIRQGDYSGLVRERDVDPAADPREADRSTTLYRVTRRSAVSARLHGPEENPSDPASIVESWWVAR